MLDMIATASPRAATTHTASVSNVQATTTAATTAATKAHEFESIKLHHVKHMTPIMETQRSVSCFELGSDARRYRTIRIGQGSAELRQLSHANVTQLLRTATSSDSTNALLARKALRFRKIWTPEVECTTGPASVSC